MDFAGIKIIDACNNDAARKQPATNWNTVAAGIMSVAYVPDTTTAFNGSLKMFKIAPCNESGTYFDRKVPATGLNNPTQHSTTIKPTMTLVKQLENNSEPVMVPSPPLRQDEQMYILTAATQ